MGFRAIKNYHAHELKGKRRRLTGILLEQSNLCETIQISLKSSVSVDQFGFSEVVV
jgi:hypothetical protein